MCAMYVFKCYENVSLIFLPRMYVWNTCEMIYDMRYEFVHAYECMPRHEMYVWCMKEIWLCMIMKCMHDSWNEITAMSSSVNDQWKCMAYDFVKGSAKSYLATVVGGIVLWTYHWGCRWYCLLGSITEVCRCIGQRISITEVKGSYRVVGHPNESA